MARVPEWEEKTETNKRLRKRREGSEGEEGLEVESGRMAGKEMRVEVRVRRVMEGLMLRVNESKGVLRRF